MPTTASLIPLKIPLTTFPPHSSIFFWKYFCAPDTASERSPPKNADNPPNAAPISSKNPSAMPFQSIAAKPSRTFSPIVHQSMPSIAAMPKSKTPLIPSDIVCPKLTKSMVFTALLTKSASAVPAPVQSKLLIAVWKKSRMVLMPLPND